MKVKELPPELLNVPSRYLSVNAFCRAAGMHARRNELDRWIAEGLLPTCVIGRYKLVDMVELSVRSKLA